MPTIAIGDDRLEQRDRRARGPSVTNRHAPPRSTGRRARPADVAAVHDDRVGERRAGRPKDVLQPRLVASRASASARDRACPPASVPDAVDARRVELVLERFWIEAKRASSRCSRSPPCARRAAGRASRRRAVAGCSVPKRANAGAASVAAMAMTSSTIVSSHSVKPRRASRARLVAAHHLNEFALMP